MVLGDRAFAKTSIQIVKLSQQPQAKIYLKFLPDSDRFRYFVLYKVARGFG